MFIRWQCVHATRCWQLFREIIIIKFLHKFNDYIFCEFNKRSGISHDGQNAQIFSHLCGLILAVEFHGILEKYRVIFRRFPCK